MSGDAARRHGWRRGSPPERVRWRPLRGGDVSVASAARAWLRRALLELLSATRAKALQNDLELLMSELVTNAIRHGGGVVEVGLHLAGPCVRLTVRDRSPDAPTVCGTVGTDAESGRGMAIVEAVAERWGVCRDDARPGKEVWLELAVH